MIKQVTSSLTMKDICEICGGKCNAKDSVCCSACTNISAHTCCLDTPSLVPKSWKCEECAQETDQYGKRKRGAQLIDCETARKALNNSRSLVIKTSPIANTNSFKGYAPSRDKDKAVCTSPIANTNNFKGYAPSRDKDKVVCTSPIANTSSFKGYAPSRDKDKAVCISPIANTNSFKEYAPSRDKEMAYAPFRDKEKVVSTSNHDFQRAFIPAKPANEFEVSFHEKRRYASSRDEEKAVSTSNHDSQRNFIPAKPTKEYETSFHKKSTAYGSRENEKSVGTSCIAPSRDKKTAPSTSPTADTNCLKQYAPSRDKEKAVGTSNHNQMNVIPIKLTWESETSFHEKNTAFSTSPTADTNSLKQYPPSRDKEKAVGTSNHSQMNVIPIKPTRESETSFHEKNTASSTSPTADPNSLKQYAPSRDKEKAVGTSNHSQMNVIPIKPTREFETSFHEKNTAKNVFARSIGKFDPRAENNKKSGNETENANPPQKLLIITEGTLPYHSVPCANWTGDFHITDTITDSWRDIHDIQAHIPGIVSPKVFETIKELDGSDIELKLLPRAIIWPKIFTLDPPQFDDIGLYFFPSKDERMKRGFTHCLDKMDQKDLALEGSISSDTKLLVFSSVQLPRNPYASGITTEICMWGVLKVKKLGEKTAASGDNTTILIDPCPRNIENLNAAQSSQFRQKGKEIYNSGENKFITSPESQKNSHQVLKSKFQYDITFEHGSSNFIERRKEIYNSRENKLVTLPESPISYSHEAFKSPSQYDTEENPPQSKLRRNSEGNKLITNPESVRSCSHEVLKRKFQYHNQEQSSQSRQKKERDL